MNVVVVFHLFPPDKELEQCQLGALSIEQRDIIEADSFWCLSKFLDCIQDNYIFAQLGIQAKVNQLKELIQRIDGKYIGVRCAFGSVHRATLFICRDTTSSPSGARC